MRMTMTAQGQSLPNAKSALRPFTPNLVAANDVQGQRLKSIKVDDVF
jgi:hypothetical protein